jgi:hypothetical protein
LVPVLSFGHNQFLFSSFFLSPPFLLLPRCAYIRNLEMPPRIIPLKAKPPNLIANLLDVVGVESPVRQPSLYLAIGV